MSVDGKQKLIQYLADAHANETTLIQTLRAHIRIAEPGPYRTRLESHLRETQDHAEKVQRRLTELGATKSLVGLGFGLMQNVVKNSIAMAKAPVDMIRGMDVKEKMLRNARDEAMTEVAEIGTYDTIERIAQNIGDQKTVEIVRDIRADEERMLEDLRAEIPNLTDQVVRSQVPLTQRTVTSPEDLPIANYDSLTADEITSRLPGLSQADLRKVETFERNNSNRKTILERAEALRSNEPWPGYDEMTATEVTKRVNNSSPDVAETVRRYESSHKNRSSVIKATDKELVNA